MSSTKNTAVYSFAHFLDVKLAELLEHIECWRDCFRREQELTQLLIVAENSRLVAKENFFQPLACTLKPNRVLAGNSCFLRIHHFILFFWSPVLRDILRNNSNESLEDNKEEIFFVLLSHSLAFL